MRRPVEALWTGGLGGPGLRQMSGSQQERHWHLIFKPQGAQRPAACDPQARGPRVLEGDGGAWLRANYRLKCYQWSLKAGQTPRCLCYPRLSRLAPSAEGLTHLPCPLSGWHSRIGPRSPAPKPAKLSGIQAGITAAPSGCSAL